MMAPRALVLRAAGTNCDRETQFALEQAGFEADRVHVFRLMEAPALLEKYQFLVIPGGSSHGGQAAGPSRASGLSRASRSNESNDSPALAIHCFSPRVVGWVEPLRSTQLLTVAPCGFDPLFLLLFFSARSR